MVEFYQITIQAESAFLVPFLYAGSSFGIDRDQLVVRAGAPDRPPRRDLP
jgi:hypothetical protein